MSETAVKLPQPDKPPSSLASLRIVFLVEGFTDIRFVSGLAGICSLTMVVPAHEYRSSELGDRVSQLKLNATIVEIPGSRLVFQLRSLSWLWQHSGDFDVILAQEALRGAFNANLAGMLRGVPVVTYMGIAPLEYFRCRRERGQIGRAAGLAGETLIRGLIAVNGRMATRSVALGPYLRTIAARHSKRASMGLYYGVDTTLFRPAVGEERAALRSRLDLPRERFLVLLSSRISHEKDPETVIRAVAIARARGLDAVLLNLSGGWQQLLELARRLEVADSESWVMARPAVNPMTEVFDYFRAADVVAQASLAEGLGLAALESLACATPVVATAVGGMAIVLEGLARLVPRANPAAMADELMWVAYNPTAARDQAMRGRDYVVREWERTRAFTDLRKLLLEVAQAGRHG